MVTYYADDETVLLKLVDIIPTDIDTDIINDALQTADDIINDSLDESLLTGTIPKVITRIATYYACVELLDNFTAQSGKRNEVASAWEKKADKLLSQYKLENSGSDPITNYTRRNTDVDAGRSGNLLL